MAQGDGDNDKAEPAGRPDDEQADKVKDPKKQKFGYGDRNDGLKDTSSAQKNAAGKDVLVEEPQNVARADAQRPLGGS